MGVEGVMGLRQCILTPLAREAFFCDWRPTRRPGPEKAKQRNRSREQDPTAPMVLLYAVNIYISLEARGPSLIVTVNAMHVQAGCTAGIELLEL
ncbi:hypothetical protein N658DRAFT_471003, partial [Parathielavia hyrcaniae]